MQKVKFKYLPFQNAMLLSIAGIGLFSNLDPLNESEIDTTAGYFLTIFSLALAALLIAVVIKNIVKDLSTFKNSLINLNHTPTLGAIPASLLVIAASFGQMGINGQISAATAVAVSKILLLFGLFFTLCFGTTLFSRISLSDSIDMSQLSGVVFIPAVALVIVPSSIMKLVINANEFDSGYLFISLASYGAGLFLFIFLGSVLAFRIISMAPVNLNQVATWWIWLAPMGVGGLGAISTAKFLSFYFENVSILNFGIAISSLFWGFGFWWFVFATKILLWNIKDLKFNYGYWAFGFPVAAFGSLTLELGRAFQIGILTNFGRFLWVGIAFVAFLFGVKTIKIAQFGSQRTS